MGCRTAQKAVLVIKENGTAGKNQVAWKWLKGQMTSVSDFGNPGVPGGTTAYSLCVYSGITQSLAMTVPDSGTKWTVVGTNQGYKYHDPSGAADGVQKVLLKAGATGKAKALMTAKGNGVPGAMLGLSLPVTAQLVNSENSACYTTSFASAKKNTTTQFKGTTP
jgi:hypothetical protein